MKGFKLNPQTMKNALKAGAKFMEKNAPAICAGVAIAGLFGSVIAAIKAGPEVKEALEAAEIKKNEQALKERMEDGNDETPIVDLTVREKLPIYIKYFWKTGVLMLVSAGCMVASVRFGNKQIRTLAVLAAAAESNLASFEDAAKVVVGDKKFEQIKGQILDKNLEDNPPKAEFVTETGKGDTLCFEPYFKRYFRMSIENADRIGQDLVIRYHETGELTFDEIYEAYGISKLTNLENKIRTKLGDEENYDILFENTGYFKDPDGLYTSEMKYQPRSGMADLNGEKTTCYMIAFSKPISRSEFEHKLVERTFH